MKIINCDIEELKSHILTCSRTKGIYTLQKKVECEAWKYLNEKYNTNDDTIYIKQYINYLNSFGEHDIFDLLVFSKKLYIEKFGEKHGNIAYSHFSGGLMEDGENYSDILNKSKKINQYLLNDFNYIIKYYPENYKYEIGKFILICMKNLGKKLPVFERNNEFYNYWED